MSKEDKILQEIVKIGKDVAVLKERSNAKESRLESVENDVKSLNKFKWGVTGLGGVGIIGIIEEMWRNWWSQ